MRARHPLWTAPFVGVALCNLALNLAGALAIHLPGFLHQLGAGEAEIGRIMATYALSALIAGPLVGRVMDRHGRRIVIRSGTLLFALCASLYLLIDRLGAFVYCLRLLDGVAATMLYAALFTYAADVVPAERRTEGLALFGTSGLLPIGVSGELGDFILHVSGYPALFATALGFGVLSVLVGWPLRDVHRSEALSGAAPPATLLATFAQRDLRPVWVAAVAFFFAMSSVMTFIKTYVLTTGRGSVGNFLMLYAATALMLRVLLGWLPDRVGLTRMLFPAACSYAIGVLLLAYATTDVHVLLAGMCCGIGHGYAFPVLFSLVIGRVTASARGGAMAIYTCIDWAGTLIAGPVVGIVIERAGYTAGFCLLAFTLALGTTLFYGLDRAARAPA
jgi:MFS family permease